MSSKKVRFKGVMKIRFLFYYSMQLIYLIFNLLTCTILSFSIIYLFKFIFFDRCLTEQIK